jgi:hypothetical protein
MSIRPPQPEPAAYSFPLPPPGQRDPYFGLARTTWCQAIASGEVRSFVLPPGSGRGRRYIDFGSARRWMEAQRAAAARAEAEDADGGGVMARRRAHAAKAVAASLAARRSAPATP